MKPETIAKLARARQQLVASGYDETTGSLLKRMDEILHPGEKAGKKLEKKALGGAKANDMERLRKRRAAYHTEREVIIQKSDREQLRVSRTIGRGSEFINLRLWCLERSTGAFIPTRTGVTIEIGMRDALVEALQAMTE